MDKAEHDFVALGIAAAAIIMFIGTGSAVVPAVLSSLAGNGAGPDKVLINALLLNIAIIIFGWRRYRDLAEELAQHQKSEEEARLLADTDALTGALNRHSFGKALNRLITSAKENNTSVAIMMIDLDNFKQFNDMMGHSVGDRILAQTVRRITAELPEGALLARTGGDEFVCALHYNPAHPDTVDRVAAKLGNTISAPSISLPAGCEITASIGITGLGSLLRSSSSTETDAQQLLEMADAAMYHAKRSGRNSYFWFEDFMADEMRFRARITAGIREGLSKGEFVPYYEQQIDVETGKVTGFEMLARWNSPQFGLVKPDVFITIAEEAGLISQLSEQMISKALEDAKEWNPALTLAVNISPVQLRDPWFSQKLLKLLIEANFPPSRLEIEITESCVHQDVVQVRSLIASLKNQGIKVSLDDFGTGYSALSQLRMLPFDRIKIDRSFVSNLTKDDDSAAFIQSIAVLGKGLGLPITAEGIETDAIREQLRNIGQIKGQGYLYGEPTSAEETRSLLSLQGLLADRPAHQDSDQNVLPNGDGDGERRLAASK